MKRSSFGRFLQYAVPAAVFAAMIAWLVIAVGNAENVSEKEQLLSVRKSIEKGITMCYATEGAYPASLEYLTENYGVYYDSTKYTVHYECFADNVRPGVTVVEKGGINEKY